MRGQDITVVIPTIPTREAMLQRAVESIRSQVLVPGALSIRMDLAREGAAINRGLALSHSSTPWTAFLDDDDAMMPWHLEGLAETAEATGADYVYSYYVVVDADGSPLDSDPLGHFGKTFDPASPHQTTIVTLVRTELAKEAGFAWPAATPDTPEAGLSGGEDWIFTLRCIELGAKIVHRPDRSWLWYHHGANTSGQPDRW